jgi:hypothetical protein
VEESSQGDAEGAAVDVPSNAFNVGAYLKFQLI